MRSRVEFVEGFLLPLVRGGEVHVGEPLGARGIERFRRGPASVLEDELRDVRHAVCAELLLDAEEPQLDLEALRLAVAVHDLLFLYHPGSAAALAPRLSRVAAGAKALATLPETLDAPTLAARHSVLHLLPALSRTDVRVSFWAGKSEFHGQAPPARLTAWPSLRKVREERWQVQSFAEAASDNEGGAAVILALFSSSPLTDLLHPLRLSPPLDLPRLRPVLAIPELCRAVAYRYLDAGIDAVGPALASSVLAALDRRDPETARFVLSLVSHLHLCLLADTRHKSAPLASDAMSTAGETRAAPRRRRANDATQRDFYGLYAALARTAPELCAPADVRRDPALAALIDTHARACAAASTPERVDELRNAIARSLGTVSVSAAT